MNKEKRGEGEEGEEGEEGDLEAGCTGEDMLGPLQPYGPTGSR